MQTLKPAAEIVPFQIDREVCRYCANALHFECVNECAPEARYRHFAPVEFQRFDPPPVLPEYRRLRAMSADARLAMVYTMLSYLRAVFAPSG